MRLGRLDFAALCFAFFMTLGMALLGQSHPKFYPADYAIYLYEPERFYYPYWSKFILAPFALLPFWIGYVLWTWANIAGTALAARLFGGNLALALLSYPALWVIYYGQIVGLVSLGLALVYEGVAQRQTWKAGLGLILAFIKPQMGLVALLWVLLWPPRA